MRIQTVSMTNHSMSFNYLTTLFLQFSFAQTSKPHFATFLRLAYHCSLISSHSLLWLSTKIPTFHLNSSTLHAFLKSSGVALKILSVSPNSLVSTTSISNDAKISGLAPLCSFRSQSPVWPRQSDISWRLSQNRVFRTTTQVCESRFFYYHLVSSRKVPI